MEGRGSADLAGNMERGGTVPQGAVLHHESYSAAADVEAVMEYDERLDAF